MLKFSVIRFHLLHRVNEAADVDDAVLLLAARDSAPARTKLLGQQSPGKASEEASKQETLPVPQ